MTDTFQDKPRHAYYFIAHEGFRQAAEQDLNRLFTVVANDIKLKLIEQVIELASTLPGFDDSINTSSIKLEPTLIEGRPAILIRLPEPKALAECRFALIVSKQAFSTDGSLDNHDFDYFTLEIGQGFSSEEGSEELAANKYSLQVCLWEKDIHYAIGEVDFNATAENFIELVSAFLQAQNND